MEKLEWEPGWTKGWGQYLKVTLRNALIYGIPAVIVLEILRALCL